METPTEEDLILALQELFTTESKRPDGSLRSIEIRNIMKEKGVIIGRDKLRIKLAEMKETGIIELCDIPIKNLIDQEQTIKGWKLVRKD